MDAHTNQQPGLGHGPTTSTTPKVIGIFGLPGAGKTFLLNQLKGELGEADFCFFEGVEVIAGLVPGGLEGFKKLEEKEKTGVRDQAISGIRDFCKASGKSGIVTGHFRIRDEGKEEVETVRTSSSLGTYTHILYLDVPASVIEQRRRDDIGQARASLTTDHLRKWQQKEKDRLRRVCQKKRILFSVLGPHQSSPSTISALLQDFHRHNPEYNLSCVKTKLDEILSRHEGRPDTVLVIDADRTLANEETGELFWMQLADAETRFQRPPIWPRESGFSRSLDFTYQELRQAALIHDEAVNDEEYEALCSDIASQVTIYPEFVTLLRLASQQKQVCVVLVSCGLHRALEKVLEREGLFRTINVIAGGRISDGLVVSPITRAAIVTRLRDYHKLYTWAFGNGLSDSKMMKQANQAVVGVHSETMAKVVDNSLYSFNGKGGVYAFQRLLPGIVLPQLKFPILTELDIINKALCTRHFVTVATNKASAKFLATPMRNSDIVGPTLREAHRRAGAYLATEFITSIIGLEKYELPHVMGNQDPGYKLQDEKRTTIVALMRGGEPMATGINDVFPRAKFVHADSPTDVKHHHLQGQSHVLLVVEAITTGESILNFVQAIRSLHSSILIVIIVGVVQDQFIDSKSASYKSLAQDGKIRLVALRHTKNTLFRGGDTSNRLFNTEVLTVDRSRFKRRRY